MKIAVAILCLLLLSGCNLFPLQEAPSSSEEELVGPTWELVLVEANGDVTSASALPHTVTLKFTSNAADQDDPGAGEGKTFGGMAPCNTYHGSYTADEGNLRVSSLVTTDKGCRPEFVMHMEDVYYRGLETSESYEIKDRQLRLVFDGGHLAFQAGE